MKIRPNVASLAALTLGVAMVMGAPAFSQTFVTHHNAQKTGSAMSNQKVEQGQRGYSSTGPLFNYAPQQQSGPQCQAPLSPGGIGAAADACGGVGWNPPPDYNYQH
jgi:hypothetical protein